jgi:hypothetical protein
MRQRHVTAVVAAAAGVLFAAGPALPALAARSAGGPSHVNHHRATAVDDDRHASSGIVVSVDATAGTITISHPGDDDPDTFIVPSGATIKLDGEAATLAGIPAGARVRVGGLDDEDEATSVVAVTSWRVQLAGTVASVDTAAGTLTLKRPATTVTVGSTAIIKLDGKVVPLGDLPTGARVQIQATRTATATTAIKLQAHAPKPRKSAPKPGKGKDS